MLTLSLGRGILSLTIFHVSESDGVKRMSISYNKLWKLMIDLNMNKTQLRKVAGLSTNIIARLSKNESVSMDTLLRICKALQCNIGDIMDIIEESDQLKITEYPFTSEPSLLKVAENSSEVYKHK
jgi:DNA (cytosine-5)-methyltransferase 1